MKLNIAYPATGCMKVIEVDDEHKLRIFWEKRIAQEVSAETLGDEWKGYIFRISGGNDKQGFPMMQGILVPNRVRLLLRKGNKCYRPRRDGDRKRKSVHGCIVDSSLSVINLVVVKKGEEEIPGLTDVTIPRPRGPKRASKIRKLFNLRKGDDVRRYVVRTPVAAKEGQEPKYKTPKIQRLVTHVTRVRQRVRLKEKLARRIKAREMAAEYAQMMAQRRAERRALSKSRSSSMRQSRSDSTSSKDKTDAAPKGKKTVAAKDKSEAPKKTVVGYKKGSVRKMVKEAKRKSRKSVRVAGEKAEKAASQGKPVPSPAAKVKKAKAAPKPAAKGEPAAKKAKPAAAKPKAAAAKPKPASTESKPVAAKPKVAKPKVAKPKTAAAKPKPKTKSAAKPKAPKP